MAKQPAKTDTKTEVPSHSPLDCVAITFQASKDSGSFSNFRIVTLFIRNGKIVHLERSQEFATFEAIARAEVIINASLWNLSSRYKPGLYTTLGGDQVRELLPRLERTNPEALRMILPLLDPEEKLKQ